MSYIIHHTPAACQRPNWSIVERWDEGHRSKAMERANWYAQERGGYVCVKDQRGITIFGTDPAALDLAIVAGNNRDFRMASYT